MNDHYKMAINSSGILLQNSELSDLKILLWIVPRFRFKFDVNFFQSDLNHFNQNPVNQKGMEPEKYLELTCDNFNEFTYYIFLLISFFIFLFQKFRCFIVSSLFSRAYFYFFVMMS